MAQVLIRNLDEDLKKQLKESAQANGRSLEAEVRERLRSSVSDTGQVQSNSTNPLARKTRREITDRFRGVGFTPEEVTAIEALRRAPLVTDELDADVRAYWEERAQANGHTLSEEVRELLTEKARWFRATGRGLGSDIVRLFRDDPFERGEIEELPLRGWQSPAFDEE